VLARIAEPFAIFGVAAVVTAAIAAPVLRAPSERVFGMPIVGRHHDPFTVMEQLRGPITPGVYLQPVTDIPGALLARAAGPVVGYNGLILLSFPLSAVTAFLLARHLTMAPAPAAFAGLAYAFSPFHVAQAAYHPHIAQTQWLPLYLLALWRCLDRTSASALCLLVGSTIAATLSSFYGGLIAAITTPVAVLSYWLVGSRDRASLRRLGLTVATLALLALGGLMYGLRAAGPVLLDPTPFSFPREDLFRYSARWWGYLVPPVQHPLLGGIAKDVWNTTRVGDGLLEQQVSLGWGLVALGMVAGTGWVIGRRGGARPASLACVPVVAGVALFALLCSLSPERAIGSFTFVRPSAILYDVAPIFRSYARFAVMVQLMAALLAGIALDQLLRTRNKGAHAVCIGLVAISVFEYWVRPDTLWRDVLPTSAHRWVMRQGDAVRALDCAPTNHESRSVEWLTGERILLVGRLASDCAEPQLPAKLAATGFTHMIVRAPSGSGHSPGTIEPHELQVAAELQDGKVLAITARPALIYVVASAGFYPREHEGPRSWEWMGASAAWTLVNSQEHTVSVFLDLELSAFHHPRKLELLLDGGHLQALTVVPHRRTYRVGPFALLPGHHAIVFRALDAPTVAADVIHNGDPRPLTFALATWKWSLREEGR
jgi:hypothetical protein